MYKLLDFILSLFPLGLSTKSTVNQAQTDEGETSLRSDRRWEEALAASMYDDNARMFLDHYGPRRLG
ncbi:MAG TPA: hypothetical protein VMX97_14555 [Hyphomicrobiaceae bacterium]|nr:hypothetical protein [Hyphomicrobiaceae bacterium]